MKFALVNGEKREAEKRYKGFCPSCGSELIPRCGEVKIHHWAHKGVRNCDPWWENETPWHREWKGHFPKKWQEVVHFAGDGEKHIADVKTEKEWCIEFQHSYLKPAERRSRNEFYLKLVWIVDGTRRSTDKVQFEKILRDSFFIHKNPAIIKVNFPKESRLIKEWSNCKGPVFFDFYNADNNLSAHLWLLLPKISDDSAFLMLMTRKDFIEYQFDERFEELVNVHIQSIRNQLMNPVRKNTIRQRQHLDPRMLISRRSRGRGYRRRRF